MFILINSKHNIIILGENNIIFLLSKLAIFIEFPFAFQTIPNFSNLWPSEYPYKPHRQIFIMLLKNK